MDIGVGAFVVCSALVGQNSKPRRRLQTVAALLVLGACASCQCSDVFMTVHFLQAWSGWRAL